MKIETKRYLSNRKNPNDRKKYEMKVDNHVLLQVASIVQ